MARVAAIRSSCSAGCIPRRTRVGRFGVVDATTIDALDEAALRGGVYIGPVSAEHAPTGAWALPWLVARLRQPDGCPWDREQTTLAAAAPARGGLRGLRRARARRDAGAGRGAGRPVAPDRAPRAARGRGGRLRPGGRPARRSAPRSCAATPRVRGRRGPHRGRRQPALGADQGARSARRRREAGPDAADGAAATPKSALEGISPLDAGAGASHEMQERAAAPGLRLADLEGVIDKVAEELAELLARRTDRRAARGVRRPAVRRRQPRAASWASRPRRRSGRPSRKFRSPVRAGGAARRRARRGPARPRFRGPRRRCGRRPRERSEPGQDALAREEGVR